MGSHFHFQLRGKNLLTERNLIKGGEVEVERSLTFFVITSFTQEITFFENKLV